MVIGKIGNRHLESMEEETLIEYLGSESFTNASVNASRLVSKLKSAIQRQELYETHQILRTIYFRFINAKEKVGPLKDLLYHGACYLIKSNESVSGQDIAMLFLESSAKCLQDYQDDGGETAKTSLLNPSLVYHRNHETLELNVSEKVANIAVDLPDIEIGQSKFIAETLRILSPKILNRNLLHDVVANKFWQKKNYVNSRYHYLHCASLENSHDIASVLVEHQTGNANKSEVDLFITQFILQFLCLQTPSDLQKTLPNQSKQSASTSPHLNIQKTRSSIKCVTEKIFSSYTLRHPQLSQVSVPFSSLPLLNFTYFIISIIDATREAPTFRMLCDIYKVTWSRDPNYQGYLDRIGTIYFGIVDQTKPRQGGFFNNILLSLLEGTDEDEDSNQDGTNLSSCDELD